MPVTYDPRASMARFTAMKSELFGSAEVLEDGGGCGVVLLGKVEVASFAPELSNFEINNP